MSELLFKLRTIDELCAMFQSSAWRGKVIVTTNGCFDLLHVGHLRYLQNARALGDVLVVGVNSDSSVRALKGDGRPIVGENERAEMLAGFACVDYVTIFSELNPIQMLSALKPGVHVKGSDYSMEQVVELETVLRNGGRVEILNGAKGKSTTNLIGKAVKFFDSNRCFR